MHAHTQQAGDETVARWKAFLPVLIQKYHDGYRAENLDAASISMKRLFYPQEWLTAVGYFNNKMITGDNVIMFAPAPATAADPAADSVSMSRAGYVRDLLVTAVFYGTVCLVAGFYLSKPMAARRFEYQPIDL